jgi:hypothetical protein
MDNITVLFMHLLQYLSILVIALKNTWKEYTRPALIETATQPHRRYLLGAESESVESYSKVPEGRVYIEEWVQDGTKKSVVRYGGEDIPTSWTTTPFEKNAKTPWVWIGDRETEIDLTRTFNRYLVVGNVIKVELVSQLIQITDRSNLLYIESGTFKELKFPGDGITIVEYDDHRAVQTG